MTTAEVAERLGKARNTVLQMVEYGHIAPIEKLPGLTGAYLFNRAEIEALAAKRQARRAGAEAATA